MERSYREDPEVEHDDGSPDSRDRGYPDKWAYELKLTEKSSILVYCRVWKCYLKTPHHGFLLIFATLHYVCSREKTIIYVKGSTA